MDVTTRVVSHVSAEIGPDADVPCSLELFVHRILDELRKKNTWAYLCTMDVQKQIFLAQVAPIIRVFERNYLGTLCLWSSCRTIFLESPGTNLKDLFVRKQSFRTEYVRFTRRRKTLAHSLLHVESHVGFLNDNNVFWIFIFPKCLWIICCSCVIRFWGGFGHLSGIEPCRSILAKTYLPVKT